MSAPLAPGSYALASGLVGFTSPRLRVRIVELCSDGIHANVLTAEQGEPFVPLTLRVDTLEPTERPGSALSVVRIELLNDRPMLNEALMLVSAGTLNDAAQRLAGWAEGLCESGEVANRDAFLHVVFVEWVQLARELRETLAATPCGQRLGIGSRDALEAGYKTLLANDRADAQRKRYLEQYPFVLGLLRRVAAARVQGVAGEAAELVAKIEGRS